MSPKDPNAHNNLAATLKELGKLNEAEFSYREAISLDQNCAVAYNNLANVLTKKNEYKEAEENYRIAISLKDDYSEAHQNLGISIVIKVTLQRLNIRMSVQSS